MTYTKRVGAAGNLTAAQVDANFENVSRGLGLDPVTITATGNLTDTAHAGRELFVNSATAVTLTIRTQANGGPATPGTRIYGTNLNVGAITLAAESGSALTGDSALPSTIAQYGVFDVIVTAANAYLRRA
jgi:hypothetical protein